MQYCLAKCILLKHNVTVSCSYLIVLPLQQGPLLTFSQDASYGPGDVSAIPEVFLLHHFPTKK